MQIFLRSLFFLLLLTQICFAQPVSPSASQGGWYQQNSGTDKNLYGVQFTDANKGFAVGDSGIILKTTNGGGIWEVQPSETILPLNDIYFIDVNNGWIAGGNVVTAGGFWAAGLILRTTNGGVTWYKQLEDSIDTHYGVFFSDTENGWTVGYTIWATTDGGTNWFEILGMGWEVWSGVSFKNLDTGIVAGTTFGEGRGSWPSTIRTTNGWGSFILEGLPVSNQWFGDLSGICSPDFNSAFVVGGMVDNNHVHYGLVGKTTDWGTTWSIECIEGLPFNDIYFINEENGWIIGSGGCLLYTNDGGVSWTQQVSGTTSSLSSTHFIDTNTGWVVGDSGTILHTTNGGVPVELTSFTANTNGKEMILNWSTATETNNQGFSIERKSSNSEYSEIGFVPGFGTTTEPKSYSYTDSKVSIGKYSYRLKQIDFDGSYEYSPEVEAEVSTPLEFWLGQNFPNPFNPSTIIKYTIQQPSLVIIKVFDVLGNEIETLVNVEKPAGTYEVEFNASLLSSSVSARGGYASGVYFYQIKSGSFVETKKMILLK